MTSCKEYLEKQPDGTYSLVLRGDVCKKSDILIPEGAEAFGYTGMVYTFYKNEFRSFFNENTNNQWEDRGETLIGRKEPVILWQLDQDEPFLTPECTLNDQYAEIEQVRQAIKVKSGSDSDHALDAMSFGIMGAGAAQASGGAKARENNHYFINVSDVDEVDFYEIAKRYNVTDPAVQHILKKCLAIGNRGHKDLETDLKDILKTAKRALQINGFGE